MNPPPETASTPKDPTDAKIEEALKPAEVTLTVKEPFVDVLARSTLLTYKENDPAGNRGTEATMTMDDHPRVQIERGEIETLKIRPKGATIRFIIKPDEYYPIGIAFKLLENKGAATTNDAQRLGLLNFEQIQMPRGRHSLQITDCFKDKDDDDRYKFSVIIQRASDGAIGIIDPGIEHVP